MTTIGKTIETLRVAKNLTQKQLADWVKVKQQSVNKWENGTNMPATGKLPLLAEALNTTVEHLLSVNGTPESLQAKVAPAEVEALREVVRAKDEVIESLKAQIQLLKKGVD